MPGEYMPDLNDPIPNTAPSSFNHDKFAGWFYLPALQHLEIWLRDTTKLHERPPELTNLRTLILARSTIPEEDVPFLLGRASSLQNLHLGLVYSYYDESVFQKSDCITQALVSVSSTVERLSISLDHVPVVVGHGNPDWGELERYKRVRESLKKFTSLQTAELPMSLFVYYIPYPENHTDISAIWPDTLHEVGLRDDMTATHENRWNESRIIDWVQDMLLNQRNAVSQLERIVIRVWEQYYDDLWEEDENRLRERCREERIPLDIVADDLGRGLWCRKLYNEF